MTDLAERARTAHADGWEVEGRLRERYGGGAARVRGIRLMASGIAHPQWNNGDVHGADADVEGARAFYAGRGLPWGVRVPEGMAWTYGRHLFRKRLMGLDSPALVPAPEVPGLVVRRGDDLDAVVGVSAAAFAADPELERRWVEPHLGASEVLVALAELDGVPVGTAHAVRSDGEAGPCLYVAGVGVLAEARRRGVAARMTSWLLEQGFTAGADFAHLHPDSDPAAAIYARLGFRETRGLDIYIGL
jgi:ribosomal protein S18 acetylase RimI-like enzyme